MSTTPAVRAHQGTLGALVADLVAVVAFAAAGRQSHEPGSAAATVLLIAWPFATAAVVAHVALLRRGPEATTWRGGLVVVGATYALGMLLRGLSGRGLDPAFLVVALLSLLVLMLGWRLLLLVARRRR